MKKLAIYILVPSLIVGSCGAGVYVYQKNKQANTYVKVVPVSSISTSDYGSDMYMYGQSGELQAVRHFRHASYGRKSQPVCHSRRIGTLYP